MTAEIYNIRDYHLSKRQISLKEALDEVQRAFDALIYESSLGFNPDRDMLADTTPCEYVAPDSDPA